MVASVTGTASVAYKIPGIATFIHSADLAEELSRDCDLVCRITFF